MSDDKDSKMKWVVGGAVLAVVGGAYFMYSRDQASKKEARKVKKAADKAAALAKNNSTSKPTPAASKPAVTTPAKPTTTTPTPTATASAPVATAPSPVATATATAPTPTPAAAATPTPTQAAVAQALSAVASETAGGELSKDDLLGMFKDIVAGMDSLIFQLARTEHKLRNENVDKNELLATLSQAYTERMQQIQAKAFEKFNTTEEAAERAIEKYQNDPQFLEVRGRMDLINNALMGGLPPADPEQLAKMPAWLTVEKVIEIFTAMMETMTQSMVDSVNEVSAKHSGPPPHEEVNEVYLGKIAKVKDEVLDKYNLDEKMLDVAMLKYADNPTLGNVMIALQTSQEKKFQELRQSVWGV